MILSSDEAKALRQLVDRDHPLAVAFDGLTNRLEPTPRNGWARDQVADWRARHDPYRCDQCTRPGPW